MTSFQVERLDDVYDEAKGLLLALWDEAAFYRDFPLKPDIKRYLAMEAAGHLLVVTARHDGKLIGYATSFLQPNPHYQILQSYGDQYFVLAEHRNGVGLRMLKFAEDVAREKGAIVASNAAKIGKGAIFGRLGYNPFEVVYVKRLDHA